ncbi:hypothetical protein [Xanthomonas cannabis]|uniref:hypothetical protein n=1 Tax=Xanthomonas cannabis TaxID=1885674 RepID=UPI001F34C80E|nr:hypothetical protein [Xanthomonas cannabis]
MTFRSKRPMSIGRAVAALVICTSAQASLAGTLLAPSTSVADDQRIDAVMPPLLNTPATARTAATPHLAAQRAATTASRAFPLVTPEFKQFLDAQAQLSSATPTARLRQRSRTLSPSHRCSAICSIATTG